MKFQTILLTVFGIVAVVSVIVFAKFPAKGKEAPGIVGAHGNVTIWGTFPLSGDLAVVLAEFNKEYGKSFTANYVFHDPATFDSDIVEALASGRGPDILLLPDNLILRHTDKIQPISYAQIPQLVFQSTFIQAGEIYMRDQGLIALPFAVDPMVMYWNRDLFSNASVTQPPVYWDEFLTLAPKITKRNIKTADILESTIAFGEYSNVQNAKDILAMLFLQVGNPIVKLKQGELSVDLVAKSGQQQLTPDENVVSAFRFFMDFSNPLKNIYSWSRALPNSRDQFINGNLAVYFDYASAYKTLQEKNPHLNFAVAPVPQLRGTTVDITFAHVHGLAVLKTSDNMTTAFIAVQRLLDTKASGDFAKAFHLPPVRRDLLNVRPTDAVFSVLFDAAIRARTWLDPRPEDSDLAFRQAVESVSSGRFSVGSAINNLAESLETSLRSYRK